MKPNLPSRPGWLPPLLAAVVLSIGFVLFVRSCNPPQTQQVEPKVKQAAAAPAPTP